MFELRALSALKGERVVTHNIIVGAGTIVAGTLGVAFQVVISHRLTPADYGSVFAILTIVNLLWLPASAFTLAMARQASRDRAAGDYAASVAMVRGADRILMVGGSFLGLTLALASPWLSAVLGVPVPSALAAAIGVPFGLAIPLLLGHLQGEQRFLAFSGLAVGQAALKVIAAVAIGWWLGPVGIILGVSVGASLSYVLAKALIGAKPHVKPGTQWLRPTVRYLAIVVPSTMAISFLLSADVLIVKHFFPPSEAGQYAAVVALGRAIYWGAGGIASVLFVKIIFRETRGGSGAYLASASLLLLVLAAAVGLPALSLASHFVLGAFAGPDYIGGSAYLPWYGLAMTLFGCSSLVIAIEQSRGKGKFLAVLIPTVALELVLLVLFHSDLAQVVLMVNLCMAILLAGLGILYLADYRGSRRSRAEESQQGQTTVQPAFLAEAVAPAHAGVDS